MGHVCDLFTDEECFNFFNTAGYGTNYTQDAVGVRKKLGKMNYGPHTGKWRDVPMLERRSKIVC